MSKRRTTKNPTPPKEALPPTPKAGELLNADSQAMIAWFDSFDGANPYAFLSNFWVGEPITIPLTWGQLFVDWDELYSFGLDPMVEIEGATGEHIFAAFKARDFLDFLRILEAKDKKGRPDPGKCKGIGRTVKLRHDWEAIKYDVMAMVLAAKFTLDREEGQWLLDTGDALLIEGTMWLDKVWGVDLVSKYSSPIHSRGRNWLGTLLMARRAELRAQKFFALHRDTAKHFGVFAARGVHRP